MLLGDGRRRYPTRDESVFTRATRRSFVDGDQLVTRPHGPLTSSDNSYRGTPGQAVPQSQAKGIAKLDVECIEQRCRLHIGYDESEQRRNIERALLAIGWLETATAAALPLLTESIERRSATAR